LKEEKRKEEENLKKSLNGEKLDVVRTAKHLATLSERQGMFEEMLRAVLILCGGVLELVV
jgi:hypothetical protein